MSISKEVPPQRTLKEYFGLVLRGFCMGASDVVPGVSGGTMAFILGIYEELIDSIKSIDLNVIKLLLSFKIKEVFTIVPWQFLLSVLFGILLAIFSLAEGIEWLLKNEPVLIWSFFFGLVIASVFVVKKRITKWSVEPIVAMIVATVVSFIIVGQIPAETPNALWFIFLSGAIVICAMILPGISGSFILVLLGKYQHILEVVNNVRECGSQVIKLDFGALSLCSTDILTLGVFAIGAGVGIITFARVLSWLFKEYHDITVAVLMGLMMGSLRKIWPWKETLKTITDSHGELIPIEQINILPPSFTNEVIFAIGLAILGFVLVFGLETLANKKQDVEAH